MVSKKGDYRKYIESQRKYRKEHAEQRKEYGKQWRQKHPDYHQTKQYKDSRKEYREQHSEEAKEYARKWREQHPEYQERRRQWAREHPEITRMWRKNSKHSDEAKKQRLLDQAKWREQNPERVKIYTYIHDHEEEYPLAETCELCPEDDIQKATIRHHPDYEFPEIFVSCCDTCHVWVHRVPVFYPIVPLVS